MDLHRDFTDFGGGASQAVLDGGFKKNTSVQQMLFEFGRKRNLKENEMEDILQVPSFKRLANDFDVNIKTGVQNLLPIVLMRIFVQVVRMLTYAHVCSRMHTHAHACSRVLMRIFVQVVRMRTYAHVC
jgi:hypothetical protein